MGISKRSIWFKIVSLVLLLPTALLPASALAEVSLRNSVEGNVYILIEGEITPGFYEDFINAARQAHERNLSGSLDVVVSSTGGDVSQAMQIGAAMRELRLPVSTPITHLLQLDSRCFSACFFIWAGAVDRVGGSDQIGIHRPRFDRSYYSGLSSSEASKKYRQLVSYTKEYLLHMGVRTSLIERMYQIPADEMHVLSGPEVQQYGLSDPTPAYDEWLDSKCGAMSKSESQDWWKLKTLGPKSGFPDGYAQYLLKKDKLVNSCRSKAQWEDKKQAAVSFFSSEKK